MTAEPRRNPHAEVPKDRDGRADDRFDGTDSGPDGWDTPYPPVDPDLDPVAGLAEREGSQGPERRAPRSGTQTERRPTRAVDGDSYETDGPDEPGDTPQR
ncbi:MAG: hypothetical protein ABWZ82_00145 [Candidatus Limnocylindrales bacterium]